MKVATWNVNSVRVRMQRLTRWLQTHAPDVLCLQEIKTQQQTFPLEALQAAGYRAAVYGQKTYNGVAILSRSPIDEPRAGLDDGVDDPQARLIAARVQDVQIISVYVPNGSTVGSDKYAYKLAWLERLRSYLDRHCAAGEPVLLCGDFNVAPADADVADPDAWRDTVLCHAAARAALQRVVSFGLVDLFRLHHPALTAYSWWDYRRLAFAKNDGLRLDLIFGTAPVAARLTAATIDRDERKGKQPSDHAPVVVEV